MELMRYRRLSETMTFSLCLSLSHKAGRGDVMSMLGQRIEVFWGKGTTHNKGLEYRNGKIWSPLSNEAVAKAAQRHSGKSRNPGFKGLLDPGVRRGDGVSKF